MLPWVLLWRESGELAFRVEAGNRSRIGNGRHSGVLSACRTVFLLTRGRDSTVLKGTEVTAYTKRDASVEAEDLPFAKQSGSELPEMIRSLPRVLNGESREGDMPNLIFMAKEDDLQGAFARTGRLKVEMERAARLRAARL